MPRVRYDLLLYLGVHHHLERQMSPEALARVVLGLLERTERLFTIRTDLQDEVHPTIVAAGFEPLVDVPADGQVGRVGALNRHDCY